jgi:hypothetical protein
MFTFAFGWFRSTVFEQCNSVANLRGEVSQASRDESHSETKSALSHESSIKWHTSVVDLWIQLDDEHKLACQACVATVNFTGIRRLVVGL